MKLTKKWTSLIKPFVLGVIRTANVYLLTAVLNLLPNFIAEMVIISTQQVFITHFSIALADFINTNFRSLNVFQKV